MGNTFATGRYAKGVCAICGLPFDYAELRDDGQVKKLRVCPECWSPQNPQEKPARAYDPIALRRPSPDVQNNTFEVTYPLYMPSTGTYFGTQGQFQIGNSFQTLTHGQVVFSSAGFSVTENAGPATITVTRQNGSFGAASVNYATSDGTAVAPGDYTATNGTLNWSNGESDDKSFQVTVNDDVLVEGSQTVNLTLSSVVGALLGSQSTAVLTITDVNQSPTNLAVTGQSATSVDLEWDDNSGIEDGFKIERCTGAACSGFAQIDTVGPNVTSYTDNTVVQDTTYRYRVRAYKNSDNSDYSNEVEVDVLYETSASDFDGTDYGNLGAGGSVSDGKSITCSFWVRIDSLAAAQNVFVFRTAAFHPILISITTGGVFAVQLRTPANGSIISRNSLSGYSTGTWIHSVFSVNTAGGANAWKWYINDVSQSFATPTNADIDFTGDDVIVGAQGAGFTSKMNACLSEFFLTDSSLDLSVAGNRQLFRTAGGKPTFLGATGQLPFGSTPLIYLPDGNPENNLGTIGTFTNTGTLDVCSTSPSD